MAVKKEILVGCKANALTILMHQMHISTTKVSSVMLRSIGKQQGYSLVDKACWKEEWTVVPYRDLLTPAGAHFWGL
jgi:hypothetical protein